MTLGARRRFLRSFFPAALLACVLLPSSPAAPISIPDGSPPVTDTTWVDHDAQPFPKPSDGEPDFYGHLFREAIVYPLSHAFDLPDKFLALAQDLGAHTRREAVNVNAFDEVSHSTWFTNRNHIRAVPVSQLLLGPDSTLLPTKPWTIKHPKHGGASAGFQIKDAAGRKWLVKLDWHGYLQLSSGADMVARTLLHAAGYSVPHNEPVRFRREDLTIDKELLRPGHGERFTEADLDSVLAKGATFPDGEYSATASLFLPGHALGATLMDQRRRGDENDWYSHPNRRELRGLYVVASWLGDWDTKDVNFIDMFDSTGTGSGYVKHYILDAGSSFGADANGVKRLKDGYESVIDFGWIARRLVTLGFVVEPWRRAHQDTGVPSLGRFESDVFDPGDFTPGIPDPAFREMTDADAYWGAKIVASFSDAQIRAAVEAAHYEDPRAPDFLVRNLIERRDKIARYWFARVAPLDFFVVRDGEVRFHDLAVDRGLEKTRAYDVEVESAGATAGKGERLHRRIRLGAPNLPLDRIALPGASRVSLEVFIEGKGAKPVRVELGRREGEWNVTRVRHG
jgi:hypothetical protein